MNTYNKNLFEALDNLNSYTLDENNEIFNNSQFLNALKLYKSIGNGVRRTYSEEAEILSKVIQKYGVPITCELHRNECLEEIIGGKRSDWYDNPEQFEEMIEGKTITPGGYLSTSKNPLGMLFNGIEIKFTSVGSNGLDISEMELGVDVYDREKEVLFDIGTSYRIDKVKYYNYSDGKLYDSLAEYKLSFTDPDDYERFVIKLEGVIL